MRERRENAVTASVLPTRDTDNNGGAVTTWNCYKATFHVPGPYVSPPLDYILRNINVYLEHIYVR